MGEPSMRRARRARRAPGPAVAVTMSIFLAVAFLATNAVLASGPTRGPIPPEAFEPGADWTETGLIPDFVPASGPDGSIVGYVTRESLVNPALTEAEQPQPESIEVYSDDLSTIVGLMVPGKGFVPVGVDPDSIPDIPLIEAPASQDE